MRGRQLPRAVLLCLETEAPASWLGFLGWVSLKQHASDLGREGPQERPARRGGKQARADEEAGRHLKGCTAPVRSQGAPWSTDCTRRRWSCPKSRAMGSTDAGQSAVGQDLLGASPGEAAPISQGQPPARSADVRPSKAVSAASGRGRSSQCARPPPAHEALATCGPLCSSLPASTVCIPCLTRPFQAPRRSPCSYSLGSGAPMPLCCLLHSPTSFPMQVT